MGGYVRRVVDEVLDEFAGLRAISLHGPRGVGKTSTARERARTVLRLDTERDLERLRADPSVISTLRRPLLVDEWQAWPESWNLVRHAVDDGAPPGSYLLTGSSPPRGARIHSGAGRIVGIRMRPMSLWERGVAAPAVSLADLLRGAAEIEGRTDVVLEDYVDEIVASGFPAIRGLPPRLRRAELDSYLESIVQREMAEQGFPVRRPEVLRRWLAAYAAASSAPVSYEKILRAAVGGEGDQPAKTTTVRYRDALSNLWLLDPVEAWSPSANHLERMGRGPKHQLADPALAARLLGVGADALLGRGELPRPLRDGTLLGALFESLVTLDVKVYAEAADARVRHLRDAKGRHEVDLVVVREDGGVLALEVKLAATVHDEHVTHLHWLRDRLGHDLVDAAVITTGNEAYRRADGIAVIPAALLGP
jgi:predicted AAA+ superfamily ATPase